MLDFDAASRKATPLLRYKLDFFLIILTTERIMCRSIQCSLLLFICFWSVA